MTIWLPKSASIQPRTSLGKSDVSWPSTSSRRRSRPARRGPGRPRTGPFRLRRRMKNELNFPPHFERLVLGCIEADFCNNKKTRWKALDEIYKIYILLHRSDLKISAKNRQHFFAIELMNFRFLKFVVEFCIFSANF